MLSARAKLNLYLHITGRRDDGYHFLESLVVFTDLADQLSIHAADHISVEMHGEFAPGIDPGAHNLVVKAAHQLQQRTGCKSGAKIILEKNIPVGAGLGGGSADAAATLRGLNHFWRLGLDDAALVALAIPLGADVAMCLAGTPLIARGIGEELSAFSQAIPALHAVLVHPRTPLLTKDVYGAFVFEPIAPVWDAQPWDDVHHFIAALSKMRNHLQRSAIGVSPVVAEVLLALEGAMPQPHLVRMSGSGACCFGLYTQLEQAQQAAQNIAQAHPHWWVKAVSIER